jgi:hypothetical protein
VVALFMLLYHAVRRARRPHRGCMIRTLLSLRSGTAGEFDRGRSVYAPESRGSAIYAFCRFAPNRWRALDRGWFYLCSYVHASARETASPLHLQPSLAGQIFLPARPGTCLAACPATFIRCCSVAPKPLKSLGRGCSVYAPMSQRFGDLCISSLRSGTAGEPWIVDGSIYAPMSRGSALKSASPLPASVCY